jgi:hypothetical protein
MFGNPIEIWQDGFIIVGRVTKLAQVLSTKKLKKKLATLYGTAPI